MVKSMDSHFSKYFQIPKRKHIGKKPIILKFSLQNVRISVCDRVMQMFLH